MLHRAWTNTGSCWRSCSANSGTPGGPLGPSFSWLDPGPDLGASLLSDSSCLHCRLLTPWTSPVVSGVLPSLANSAWFTMGQLWPGVTLGILCCCSCPCGCCCCWLWLFPIARANCIRALLTDCSFVDLCCCPQRWGIQHLQNWYMKNVSTNANTNISMTPVEPPKLKATIASLSVSEAEVRMLSSTWGAFWALHISVLLSAVYHLSLWWWLTYERCVLWVQVYTGVCPQLHYVEVLPHWIVTLIPVTCPASLHICPIT